LSQTTAIENWIVRLRAGDTSARRELLTCAGDRLRSLAGKMMREFPRVARWEQIDDVLQNAQLRLYRALEQVDVQDARHFFRLAGTQIRRELIDLYRRYHGPEGMARHHDSVARRRPGKSGEDTKIQRPEPQADTADPQSIESWTQLHEAAERLPAELKEVFDLVWYHGSGWNRPRSRNYLGLLPEP
jgi:RNA polymerase sigma-70 factor (ECF subfamily)